jgi:hypothetical protein
LFAAAAASCAAAAAAEPLEGGAAHTPLQTGHSAQAVFIQHAGPSSAATATHGTQ